MLENFLPPFLFPCDFTHQLSREGPWMPLQPAFRVLVQMLQGGTGLQTSALSFVRCRRL